MYHTAFTVFTSITCQFAPDEISSSYGDVFSGTGKYSKTPQKYIDSVDHAISRRTALPDAENPVNWYQVNAVNWYTEISVDYAKTG